MHIAFFSTIGRHSWGGSEELWNRAAYALLERGHQVSFSTSRCPPIAEQLKGLMKAGAQGRFRALRRRIRIGRRLHSRLERIHLVRPRGTKWLHDTKPDMVVISLSSHTDDPLIANACHRLGIPYVLLIQAACSNRWIGARHLPEFRAAYQRVRHVFFVSADNRDIVEANLAMELSGAQVVDNPFTVPTDAAPSWPATEPFWKVAVVARVDFLTKGHDLAPARSSPVEVAGQAAESRLLGQR